MVFIQDTHMTDSDWDDFELAMQEFEEEGIDLSSVQLGDYPSSDDSTTPNSKHIHNTCQHLSYITTDKNVRICEDCNEDLTEHVLEEDTDELPYQGGLDQKHNIDPKRCHQRKDDTKGIHNDVKGFGFPEDIVMLANDIFTKMDSTIKRGDKRKAIILACICGAYKWLNRMKDVETLMKIFDLKKKKALDGIRILSDNIPDQYKKLKTMTITPKVLISDIMKTFNAEDSHISATNDIFDYVYQRSKKLKRSRPKSVAAGIVFYYFSKIVNKTVTKEKFRSVVQTSDLTIDNMVKEVDRIMKKRKAKAG